VVMVPMVVTGLLSAGVNLAWQPRHVSSRSIQAWNRPVLTCRASRVTVQFPARATGSIYATMWLSPLLGVVLAVIDTADDLTFDEQIRSLTEAHGPASGVPGRVDPDGELVRAVVPDLELVEGDVCGIDDEGKGTRLPRRDAAAGMRPPAEVVPALLTTNRPGVAASSSSSARSTSVVPSLGPQVRPALMLITQGCDPAVREMKSTASSRRTESPRFASPPVVRSARWTKMRSASGAIPAGPPAWPFPAAVSRTWVPWVPCPARSAIAG